MRFGMMIALCVLVVLPATAVVAKSAPNARFLTVYGPATAPFGYLAFCERYRADCRLEPGPRSIHLTAKRWDDLEAINEVVNRTVVPTSDLRLYGTVERWDYPGRAGDCEDYVLQKRRLLIG
ncbi:MAG: transglutaminase-like cysteine peptidase, partial [Pseudomonadota bacterium]